MSIAISLSQPGVSGLSRVRAGMMLSLGLLAGLIAATAVTIALATRLFGFHVLTVDSASMAPELVRGDVIVVKPVPIEIVSDGDVVLFLSGGDRIPTVHRAIGRNEIVTNITDRRTGERDTVTSYRLVTKGDANPAPDAREVTAEQLLGRVWFTMPGAGFFFGLPVQELMFAASGVFIGAFLIWTLGERAFARRRRTVGRLR
jgi:signal peptidase